MLYAPHMHYPHSLPFLSLYSAPYTHTHYHISQLLAEVSIKQCDADYTFAEEENILSKNRYRGLCPCMHIHTTQHTQHTQHYI